MYKKFGLIILFFFLTNITSSQVTFVIESIPENTPDDDTIYLSGTFNKWRTDDPKYAFIPQLDGRLAVTFTPDTQYFEYKFTRGNWNKVETGNKNEYIPNRTYYYKPNDIVYITVTNWQDLGGGKQFNYLVLIFAAQLAVCAILFLVVFRTENKNPSIIYRFIFFNSLLSVLLLGGIVMNVSNSIFYSKLIIFSPVIFFLWPIWITKFIQEIYPVFNKKQNIKLWEYLPVLLVFIVGCLKIINFGFLNKLLFPVSQKLSLDSIVIVVVGFIIYLAYHIFIGKNIFKKASLKLKYNKLFTISLFLLSSLIFLFATAHFIVLALNSNIQFLKDNNILILLASVILFIEFVFFWNYPQIIQKEIIVTGTELANTVLKSEKILPENENNEKQSGFVIPNAEELKIQLKNLMETQKPFKNPELNMAELAELLEIKPHVLSKLLNEYFNRNFRDFINEYRVNEFISLSVLNEYKNYTFLALAFEVGFNSKSTFNLAFKKITGLSPSEYLKQNFNILQE